MPEAVSLALVIPPELGPADAVIAEVNACVVEVERSMREHRSKTGARVVGRSRILAQSWRASPTSSEPRRNLRPRFAGTTSARVTALLGFREFLAAYRDARRCWLSGARSLFPTGTYWLARFAAVPVAPCPSA
jgi:hypothetical protein